MTEPHISKYQEDKISLLDILLIIAKSWKLLVSGVLIASVLAGGVSFFLPKTYESVAVMRLSEEEIAILHAAPVLDPLIEKFGLLAAAGGNLDVARQDLMRRLSYSSDKKTKLITVTAKADSADQARQLGVSAIALLLDELQPKGKEKKLLERAININSQANILAEDVIDSVQRSLKNGRLSDQGQESAIKSLSILNSDVVKRAQENAALLQKLEPRGIEVFVQDFTLPQRSNTANRGKFIILIVIITGCVLLTFVFLRAYIKTVIKDQRSAAKLIAIRSELVFFRGRT